MSEPPCGIDFATVNIRAKGRKEQRDSVTNLRVGGWRSSALRHFRSAPADQFVTVCVDEVSEGRTQGRDAATPANLCWPRVRRAQPCVSAASAVRRSRMCASAARPQ